MRLLMRLIREDGGATLVEYAVLLGLIMLVSFAVISTLGTSISGIFNTTNASFSNT
jgi:Flp pilus assembly pilin Flp